MPNQVYGIKTRPRLIGVKNLIQEGLSTTTTMHRAKVVHAFFNRVKQ